MTENDSLKRCPKCGESKARDAFAKDISKKDGRHSHCKACVNSKDKSEYMRAYDLAHADEIRVRKQNYYIANKEDINKKHNAYYAANKEATLERQHNFYMNNSQMIRARNRANTPKYRDTRRACNQRRRARKKAAGGDFTAEELTTMRLAQAGICAYCTYQYDPDALTIDHIIPLDQGGPHEAANICLACERCNKSKGNRTPEQWVDRWYWRTLYVHVDRRKKRKANENNL